MRLRSPISDRVPEAVRLAGLSRSRLYELLGASEIARVKAASPTLILMESLRQLIESKRSG